MKCRTCNNLCFHPGCVFKHKIYKGNEYVKCEKLFDRIVKENEKKKMDNKSNKETLLDLTSAGISIGNSLGSEDIKIDWVVNKKYNVLSPECPTYKRTIEEEKRRVGWNISRK